MCETANRVERCVEMSGCVSNSFLRTPLKVTRSVWALVLTAKVAFVRNYFRIFYFYLLQHALMLYLFAPPLPDACYISGSTDRLSCLLMLH